MNHAHAGRTAYLVGGGIATLAAAVHLVRDGHFQGRNIAILGEATLGGSLDAGGFAQQGHATRGKVGNGFGLACATSLPACAELLPAGIGRARIPGQGQTSLQEYSQGACPLNRIENARIHRGYCLLDVQQAVHADLSRSG